VIGQPIGIIWTTLAIIAIVTAWLAQPMPREENALVALVALVCMVTLLDAADRRRFRPPLGWIARWLRGRPALYWLTLIVVIFGGLALWTVERQPTYGRWLVADEYCYLACLLWIVLYLLFYDSQRAQLREMGVKLAKSPFTGILITITTLLILFTGLETYLRLFYITTDAYGFTAMNYHWYNNFYWGRYNSVGFRDYEPIPDRPGLTRVAILGDSFAMGHGIDNIDDTFPQLLERALGADYDVNVIAHSGWDTDIQLFQLQSYPLKPDIVFLSYYLNDIDYLLTETDANPDRNFDTPDNPALSWFILNFFVPNFAYYNLMQFTSTTRSTSFVTDLTAAYTDDALWSQQAQRLFEIVVWCRDNDIDLRVLLWPHILELDASQPAINQLRGFFEVQRVPVIDMTPILRDNPSPGLIVNRFDTHPGLEAQRLAAAALYTSVMETRAD
jgi:hypothetical protein